MWSVELLFFLWRWRESHSISVRKVIFLGGIWLCGVNRYKRWTTYFPVSSFTAFISSWSLFSCLIVKELHNAFLGGDTRSPSTEIHKTKLCFICHLRGIYGKLDFPYLSVFHRVQTRNTPAVPKVNDGRSYVVYITYAIASRRTCVWMTGWLQ
jgi:hypothetical protein